MMRKLTFLLILMPIFVFAQKEKGQITVSLLAGTNGYQTGLANPEVGINIVNGDSMSWFYGLAEYTASPTVGIAIDAGVTKNFSLGVALGYNTINVNESNIRVLYANNPGGNFTNYGDINYTATRYNISLRPLFHYGKNPKLDMYSGLRINVGFFSRSLETNIEGLTEDKVFPDFNKISYIPALIPFGIRYYFTKNIGIGMETHIGPPSWGNIQFVARF